MDEWCGVALMEIKPQWRASLGAPCALVYAALPLALASGSSAGGALVMAASGLGTIPALLGAGWLLRSLGGRSRRWAGVLLMALAVVALVGHAASEPLSWTS